MEPLAEGQILLVEDDRDLATTLTTALELAGHRVSATSSGLVGVLWASRTPFDVAILDLQVEDLSGLGAGKVIADLGTTAVIAVSAQAQHWQRRAFAAGATACLRKPFRLDDLLPLVRSLVLGAGRASPWPGDVVRLGEGDLAQLASLSDTELDALPFGAIQLDRNGVIRQFNSFEADASGIASSATIGRRFVDVAPCTRVQAFSRALSEAAEGASIDRVIRFVFPRRGGLCLVNVRAFAEGSSRHIWLFVSRRLGEGSSLQDPSSVPERQPAG